jgi:antirestriction protein ArdC
MSEKIYEMITNRMIGLLESGVVPWRRPWSWRGIYAGYKDAPLVRFASGRAFFHLLEDSITVPPLCDYEKPGENYCTLFHKHINSTGHEKA